MELHHVNKVLFSIIGPIMSQLISALHYWPPASPQLKAGGSGYNIEHTRSANQTEARSEPNPVPFRSILNGSA